jgi:hypothetical protein
MVAMTCSQCRDLGVDAVVAALPPLDPSAVDGTVGALVHLYAQHLIWLSQDSTMPCGREIPPVGTPARSWVASLAYLVGFSSPMSAAAR